MTLDHWLRSSDLTNDRFGAIIGTSGETVRRYRIGLRHPDPKMMQAIIDATNGAVTANDWFSIPAAKAGGGEHAA